MSPLTPAPDWVDTESTDATAETTEATPVEETEANPDATPEATEDGQQVEEATPEVKMFDIMIDGEAKSVSGEELTEWYETTTNMRAMRASSTQEFMSAAEMKKEAAAIRDDPKLKELVDAKAMIDGNPETLEEYQRVMEYLRNPQAVLARGGVPIAANPINTQLAMENSTLKREAQTAAEKETVDRAVSNVKAFRENHTALTDEQFGIFYNTIKDSLTPEMLRSGDLTEILEFYHFKHFGAVEAQVKVAEAREGGMKDAEKKLVAGRAIGGVTPAGHIEQAWAAPDKASDGLSASYNAALADKKIVFDGGA